MSSADPIYRLTNFKRRIRDLLMGRRLSADPEKTGVVDMSDLGKRCDALAEFAAQSAVDLEGVRGQAGLCARRICEELELAARTAALLETLPRTPQRVGRQCDLLEEVGRLIDAALKAEGVLEEPPVLLSWTALARREKEMFAPFLEFEGRIDECPAAMIDRGAARRAVRRALLDHDPASGAFRLAVTKDGVLRYGDTEVAAPAPPQHLARSPAEPPEVKKALDLREAAPDEGLKDFLLVKAVDEALFAFLAPRLGRPELSEKARLLPRHPGKRGGVRAEAVRRDVAGHRSAAASRSS